MTHLAAVHPQASDGEETIWTPAAARMAPGRQGPGASGGLCDRRQVPWGTESPLVPVATGWFIHQTFLELMIYSGASARRWEQQTAETESLP